MATCQKWVFGRQVSEATAAYHTMYVFSDSFQSIDSLNVSRFPQNWSEKRSEIFRQSVKVQSMFTPRSLLGVKIKSMLIWQEIFESH